MPESNYEIMDEQDIRVRYNKLKKNYQVKVGEVYKAGSSYGEPGYYCCLRIDFKNIQMICIHDPRVDRIYGRHIMHWDSTRMPIERLKVVNGCITTLGATKVADTLEEFFKKKINGELQ